MRVRKYEWMGNAYFYFGNSMEIVIQMVNDLPNVTSAYLATVYHCKLYAISIVQDGLPDTKEINILEFGIPEKYLHDFIMRARWVPIIFYKSKWLHRPTVDFILAEVDKPHRSNGMYCELQYQYYCIYSWVLFLLGIINSPYYPYYLTDGCGIDHKIRISLIKHYSEMSIPRHIKEDGFYPMHLKYVSEMDKMLYNVSHNYKEFNDNICIRFKERYTKICSIFDISWMEESEKINLHELEYKKVDDDHYVCVYYTS